jgi:hypothetical protein
MDYLINVHDENWIASNLQVEYYFSDENLPTDEFLLKYVKKNKKGFGK